MAQHVDFSKNPNYYQSIKFEVDRFLHYGKVKTARTAVKKWHKQKLITQDERNTLEQYIDRWEIEKDTEKRNPYYTLNDKRDAETRIRKFKRAISTANKRIALLTKHGDDYISPSDAREIATLHEEIQNAQRNIEHLYNAVNHHGHKIFAEKKNPQRNGIKNKFKVGDMVHPYHVTSDIAEITGMFYDSGIKTWFYDFRMIQGSYHGHDTGRLNERSLIKARKNPNVEKPVPKNALERLVYKIFRAKNEHVSLASLSDAERQTVREHPQAFYVKRISVGLTREGHWIVEDIQHGRNGTKNPKHTYVTLAQLNKILATSALKKGYRVVKLSGDWYGVEKHGKMVLSSVDNEPQRMAGWGAINYLVFDGALSPVPNYALEN